MGSRASIEMARRYKHDQHQEEHFFQDLADFESIRDTLIAQRRKHANSRNHFASDEAKRQGAIAVPASRSLAIRAGETILFCGHFLLRRDAIRLASEWLDHDLVREAYSSHLAWSVEPEPLFVVREELRHLALPPSPQDA